MLNIIFFKISGLIFFVSILISVIFFQSQISYSKSVLLNINISLYYLWHYLLNNILYTLVISQDDNLNFINNLNFLITFSGIRYGKPADINISSLDLINFLNNFSLFFLSIT